MRNCPDCGSEISATATICLCGWRPPKQPYRASPAKMPEYSTVEEKFNSMRKRIGQRRNCFLPGENFNDYQSALLASKKDKDEFDRERMRKRGWTDEDEACFRRCSP